MPNSLLWIGLVAVWLFVLVPMLVTKRPRIRQTTDAALATRVLHRGDDEPLTPRGPATGHRTDPNWRPSRERTHRHAEDRMNTSIDDRPDTETDTEPDEYPPEHAPAREPVPPRRGRGGFDPHADAVASAARYEFRQRVVLGLLIGAILTAALALVVSSTLWWLCGAVTAGLGGYLFYLRRQVRLEQEIRRRRLAKLQRSRRAARGEPHGADPRLRRPGAVVVEIDEDDPEFEYLDRYEEYVEYPDRHPGEPGEYTVPRASGE